MNSPINHEALAAWAEEARFRTSTGADVEMTTAVSIPPFPGMTWREALSTQVVNCDTSQRESSLHTGQSGNTNSKCAEDQQVMPPRGLEKYWTRGALVLYILGSYGTESNLESIVRLKAAIERLSRALKRMKINAKAWRNVRLSLKKHAGELLSLLIQPLGAPFHLKESTSWQTYVRVITNILAAWICTVDPTIHLSHTALPGYYKDHPSTDRLKLCSFMEPRRWTIVDEEAINGHRNQLDKAFENLMGLILGKPL